MGMPQLIVTAVLVEVASLAEFEARHRQHQEAPADAD